jgi:hypothetical protein
MAVAVAACEMVVRTVPAVVSLRQALGVGEGQVYTVEYLRDRLTVQPGAELGRVIRVYAVATHIPIRYCPYPVDACVGEMPVLTDAGMMHTASLPLVWGLSDPLRAWLRQLPQITRVVPPQAPHWDRPAIYRVALRMLSGPGGHISYAAVLLDASPVTGL